MQKYLLVSALFVSLLTGCTGTEPSPQDQANISETDTSGQKPAPAKKSLAAKAEKPSTQKNTAPAIPAHNLESHPEWAVQPWAGPAKIIHKGNGILQVNMGKATGKEKADKVALLLPFSPPADLKSARSVRLQIAFTNPPSLGVSVALFTGTANFYELPVQKLKSGKSQLTFDLTGKRWKSKETGWKHASVLKDASETKGLIVLLYNGGQEGTAEISHIHID